MKKIIAMILTLILAFFICTCFSGCGKKEIVVGYTIYKPMNYMDENGELIGFDTELAKAVFEGMGYKNVTFKEIKWENKYTELESGNIDCIWNGFTCNSSDDGVPRAEIVDFSYKYMENFQAVVVKKDSGITTAETLNGKLGVAESGSAGEEYAKAFEGTEFKGVTKQTDCLLQVASGNADFAVLDVQLARSYVGQGDYADLVILDELSSDAEYYAIGFAKGSELTAEVNAQLEKLAADGTIMELAKKYGVDQTVITDFSSQK